MGRDPLMLWGARVQDMSPDYSEGPGESPISSAVTLIPKLKAQRFPLPVSF